MSKPLLVLGLVLLFFGTVLASSAVQSEEIIKETDELVNTEIDSWQISAEFTQGDKVRLSVTPGEDWDKYIEPPVVDVPVNHKFIFINITDPSGKDTFIELAYAKYQDQLGLYHVRVVASNGFDVQNDSQKIVGYAGETGLHTATIWGSLPPGGKPASALALFKVKQNSIINYPHSHLLYPGVAMLIAGAVLSGLGARISRAKPQSKKGTRADKRVRIYDLFYGDVDC